MPHWRFARDATYLVISFHRARYIALRDDRIIINRPRNATDILITSHIRILQAQMPHRPSIP